MTQICIPYGQKMAWQPQTMNYVADLFDEKISGANLKLST